VATLIRNSEAAPPVVQLILFPLVFISGTYMPIHSAMLNRISGVLPVRPFNEALLGPFAQHAGFDWKNLGVLLAWGAAGAFVAVRRFRLNDASAAAVVVQSAGCRKTPGQLRSPVPHSLDDQLGDPCRTGHVFWSLPRWERSSSRSCSSR
jgi:hypothetical protein